MGPLLRMQARLHFEDLPENEQVQYLQKIALRAENPSGHNYCYKKGPPDVLSSGSLFCAGVDSYRITLES